MFRAFRCDTMAMTVPGAGAGAMKQPAAGRRPPARVRAVDLGSTARFQARSAALLRHSDLRCFRCRGQGVASRTNPAGRFAKRRSF